MLNRLRDFWDNIRRIFMLMVMLIGIALLTVVLINPASLTEFIDSIALILRILFLLALYGGFGFYVYRILNGHHRERGLKGLIARAGGNVVSVDMKIARDTIDKAITELSGIKSVEVELSERRGRAVIRLQVVLSQSNVNVLQKQNEIRRKLDHVVKKQLGIAYAEDPIIALNAVGQGEDKKPHVVTPAPIPEPAVKPAPEPTSDADEDSPEWQMIVKAAQQPPADKTGES